MPELFAVLAGYLLGSVEAAVLVSRSRGIDIYRSGSGNPGASNVLRVFGKKTGAAVMLADLLKGVAAAAIGELVGGSELVGFAAGAAAVVGHCYPIWHRFRGGKGVASAVGMLVWLIPFVGLGLAAIWAAVIGTTRVAAYGSLVIMALAIPAVALWAESRAAVLIMAAVALLIYARHWGNIRRMLTGGEQTI